MDESLLEWKKEYIRQNQSNQILLGHTFWKNYNILLSNKRLFYVLKHLLALYFRIAHGLVVFGLI